MRGFACIGLVNPKNELNIGGVLRAGSCYGAKLIVTQGHRIRYASDTQKTWKHTPIIRNVRDVFDYIPYDCVPVAVDLVEGAEPLHEFKHPERAFYIFGPEDGTLGDNVTKRVKNSVYVPTNYCMNLAATVNVVLYDRCVKLGFPPSGQQK